MMTADRFIAIKEVKKTDRLLKKTASTTESKRQISKASQFWQLVGTMATIKNQQTD